MSRTDVTVYKPTLNPEAVGIFLWSTIFRMLLRTTMIWLGFAILVPSFGIAWYMVFVALVMLNHLIGVPRDLQVLSANKLALAGEASRVAKKAEINTRKDNDLFAKRVNSEHMG